MAAGLGVAIALAGCSLLAPSDHDLQKGLEGSSGTSGGTSGSGSSGATSGGASSSGTSGGTSGASGGTSGSGTSGSGDSGASGSGDSGAIDGSDPSCVPVCALVPPACDVRQCACAGRHCNIQDCSAVGGTTTLTCDKVACTLSLTAKTCIVDSLVCKCP